MWYPSREQQQQYGWYGQMHQPCTPKPPTSSYYSNDDELPTNSNVIIHGENESSNHCQTTYDGHVHGKRRVIEKEKSFFFFSLAE